tara:strand:- start:367 stop:960 length:594 start_codon:yes stop_codon:yes gene_type:complete
MAERPVDINQLAGILNKSKSVLDKVESQMGPSGNGGEYSRKGISENSQPPLPGGMVDSSQMLTSLPPGAAPQVTSDPTRPMQQTLRNASTTKMPKEVVEAMMSNPIIPPSETSGGDVDPELIKLINPNYGKTKKSTPNLSEESVNNTTDNNNLKSLIREVVEEVIVETQVDEQLQIRVGDTIFTGKITKSKAINKKS